MSNNFTTGSMSIIASSHGYRGKSIASFALEFHDLLEYNNFKEENCCIIVYKVFNSAIINNRSVKEVYKIYKSLKDFTDKVCEDIQHIDPEYGVSFQIWSFD